MATLVDSQTSNGDEVKRSGVVYTFYSYKGGVGRSMALANVGVLMALSKHRVLLVDWDLEAPGLETYFRKHANIDRDPTDVPGILDLVESKASGTRLYWKQCILTASFTGGSLDIISSGMKAEGYRQRVQRLDWVALFEQHQIGDYIELLREEWKRDYDFILIDSRTGITDIGDICTVLLPDVLVLMFVTNHQNIEGINSVMSRAIRVRKKLPINRSALLGLPLPSRDEVYNEYDQSQYWKEKYANEFGHIFRQWLPKEIDPIDALSKLFIPYVTNWSFGERIPVLENVRELSDPTSIGAAYARVSNLLVNHLDWYALESRLSPEEIQGTRIKLDQALEDEKIAIELANTNKRRAHVMKLILAAVLVGVTAASAKLYWTIKQESIENEAREIEAITRTIVREGVDVAMLAQKAVVNYFTKSGKLPVSNIDAGFGDSSPDSSLMVNIYDGSISVEFDEKFNSVGGGVLRMSANVETGSLSFRCSATGIDENYIPRLWLSACEETWQVNPKLDPQRSGFNKKDTPPVGTRNMVEDKDQPNSDRNTVRKKFIISDGSNDCGVIRDRTFEFCLPVGVRVTSWHGPEVTSSSCGSNISNVKRAINRDNCVVVNVELRGCGYNNLLGIKNCRGRGWINGFIEVSGEKRNLELE